ncbi:MAG TPA: DUF2059 domain-containing protein [Candidatus Sulfotelmatobacter sp.]|nr:DUF2059 domain-containing protein [Candidatus Sulfotelmatobacter sp.]
MKKLSLCICFLVITSLVGAAQGSKDAEAAVPDKADVMQFLDLMHARAQMAQVLDGMAKQMRASVEEGFKQKVPDATPEQLEKVDRLCDTMFASLPMDEMIDAIVPIYQKHLTKSDLAAITAFYGSPVGQKILRELPAIMTESMQAGAEIGKRAFAAKSEEIDRQIAELVKESKKQ